MNFTSLSRRTLRVGLGAVGVLIVASFAAPSTQAQTVYPPATTTTVSPIVAPVVIPPPAVAVLGAVVTTSTAAPATTTTTAAPAAGAVTTTTKVSTEVQGEVVCKTGLAGSAPAGSSRLDICTDNFKIGDIVVINQGGANQETGTYASKGSIILACPLKFDHAAGEPVALAPAGSAANNVCAAPAQAAEGDTASAGDSPAFTGAESKSFLAVGLGLFAAGGSLVVAARRRKSAPRA